MERFDFYLPLCYHILSSERGLEMTGKLRYEAIKVSFLARKGPFSVSTRGREDYFNYYAFTKASYELPHARRIQHP